MLISFFLFFALFTGVGLASYFFKKNSIEDYLLASRGMPSWLVAMSFGATITSGATFIGFAGLAYATGVGAFVSVVALMVGDFIGWKIAGHKIREVAADKDLHTYPSLVGKMTGRVYPWVTILTSVLTVVFLGAYCSAQLVAGAKIGVQLFEWRYEYFILGGAAILLAYCWSGGIRASIWTDAVQALIIIASLLILIVAAVVEIGGPFDVFRALAALPSEMVNPFRLDLLWVALGWLVFGVTILGQPQLMVRHMAARSNADIDRALLIYMGWRITVLLLACLSGVLARILVPDTHVFDPELSIPRLWQDLLPPPLVGLLIAGLFSATMSSADSMLLSASSALTQNLVPGMRNSYMMARLGTVLVVVLIVGIALFASKGVLALVILSWGGLGAAIGPLMVVQLLGGRSSQGLAVTMMAGGFAVSALWRYGLGWHTTLMELVPGFVTGLLIFVLARGVSRVRAFA